MSPLIRRAPVLLVLFLLCSQSFASESSESTPRRQKRGIMKMMMHIMWDPVRLIRYWYAYDVTKEIAKSWRKILPTMMLLPFNPNLADTPGIAKYVHPTHGLRATKYHKNTKQFAYPAVSSGETYSASQFSKDYLIADPALKNTFSHFKPESGTFFEGSHKHSESSNLDSIPLIFRQYYNSGQKISGDGSRNVHVSSFPVIAKEVDGRNEQPHIILKPVPESFFQNDPTSSIQTSDSQEVVLSGEHIEMKPVSFPFKMDLSDNSRERIIFKAMPVPIGTVHDDSKEKLESDVVPSPSNSASKRTQNKYLSDYTSFQADPNSQLQYEDGGHAPSTKHVIHTGHQELHIVLHPIPVGNMGPSNGGQALHFVPVSFNNSESVNGGFTFVLPEAPKTLDLSQRQSSSPPNYDEEFYPSNNNSSKIDKNNYSHEEDEIAVSSENSDSKSSQVTWIRKQDPKTDRRTDTKSFDNDSEGSVPRISSMNFRDVKDQIKTPLRLNGQYIDLDQLKEDLRHGTPVLIPFQKKTIFSSPQSSENSYFSLPRNYDGMMDDKSKDAPQASDEITVAQSNSAEQYGARNSTQRLLFFFKRP
ncbi:hypothetical protein HNY73_017507 [Argiope bruennichi]|uniref:Uncharacterized protein n=1 Tax=Argiope bruennichi TaxID=94029 RepID=A0A8T0ECW9_ARGBR|nr:hypothetical protein HNY73_017507 [Argiope bruennichi]